MAQPTSSSLPQQYFEATWDFMPQLRPESLTERVKRVAGEIIRGCVVFWVLVQVLKPLIRFAVLPASWFDFTVEKTRFLAKEIRRSSLNFFRTVVTPDKAELDVFVVKRGENLPCILVCNPNGVSYTRYGTRPECLLIGQQDHPMKRLVEENNLPFNVVFFDFRCVGSRKWSKEALFWKERDLLVDVASVWEFAKQSLKAPVVHTVGHSLGGMVSAITRATLQKTEGSHLTDRSPASIDVHLRSHLGDRVGGFGAYLASLAGFNLEAGRAFSGIGGDKLAVWHPNDFLTNGQALGQNNEGPWIELRGNSENVHIQDILSFDNGRETLTRFFAERPAPQH